MWCIQVHVKPRSHSLKLVSNSNCSEGQMGSYKVTRGPHHDLTQQWRYLNLSKNSFYILFPAKGFVSSGQIISSRLWVCYELVHSLAEHFWTPVNKLHTLKCLNINYMKIPKTYPGPHKMPSRATCGPRVWDPCFNWYVLYSA